MPMTKDPDLVADQAAVDAFAHGVGQAAMEFDAHDMDKDAMMDFEEFCKYITELEGEGHTPEHLRARFDAIDYDGSGQINAVEFIKFTNIHHCSLRFLTIHYCYFDNSSLLNLAAFNDQNQQQE